MVSSRFLIAAVAVSLFAAKPSNPKLPSEVEGALERISAKSMQGHLSFLASDLLEGRATPSRGLDLAAEYIAAQFRRAGLETIPGTGSYFQVAKWKYRQMPIEGVKLVVEADGKRLELDHTHLSVNVSDPLKLESAKVFRTRFEDLAKLKKMEEGHLAGMVALMSMPTMQMVRTAPEGERESLFRKVNEFVNAVRRLKPALMLTVREGEQGAGAGGRLIDPENPNAFGGPMGFTGSAVYSGELAKMVGEMPTGETNATLSVSLPATVERTVDLKNVIGILPGSDPVLKNTYILVTGHYDHLGTTAPENGDGIYNGANDDASGTVSVMELASLFAGLKERPKRTLVFMTVFGEEKGLLGARYYAKHPVFPLAQTVANVNLEHMGRTDSTEGPQINRVSITGFDYSEVTDHFVMAGKAMGVEFYKHEKNSEAYFPRSDNQAFANAGIPAHTFAVAFDFADYHGLGDHWEKIDVENMARVNRAVARGLWTLADYGDVPVWNETNAGTEKYRKARQAGNKGGQ